MQPLNLKPSHKLVKSYHEALGQFGQLNIDHEMAVRSAFQGLLAGCGPQFDWTLVPEWPIQRPKAALIKVDGALLDTFRLARGFWEAKDEHDDLEKEIHCSPRWAGHHRQPGNDEACERFTAACDFDHRQAAQIGSRTRRVGNHR